MSYQTVDTVTLILRNLATAISQTWQWLRMGPHNLKKN